MAGSDSTRPITQREIATSLGVSIATVSMALKNSPELSEARRREIQEFADRMGYRSNSAAAELASYKRHSAHQPITSTLAWINTWTPAGRLRSYRQFDAYWTGAEAAAAKSGHRLEEFALGADLHPNRLHEILQARGIRGILLPPQPEEPHWGNFPWERYSVVKFGQSVRHPACHAVSSDQVGNAMTAFQAIHAKGYRRIGFLTDEEMARRGGHLFEAGFLMAQRFVEEEERVPIHKLAKAEDPQRADGIARWVEQHGVEAIFTDLAAAPSLLAMTRLRIPEGIGMAVTNVADIAIPAGIHQNPVEIGKVGAHLLHSLMMNNERGLPAIPKQILVDGSWVDGASLPGRGRG